MKKLIKILGITIGIVFALLIATAIAVSVFFNPNDYKGDISALVKEKTGRDLNIEGKISLSFFPWIGLEVGKTELSNAPGFGKEPFASVKHVGVKVKLLPLFSKRVVMDTVMLDGLNLNLARDKQGRSNWQDLAGANKKSAATPPPKSSGGPAIVGIDISGIKVTDAHIVWDDRQNGAHWTVDKLNLKTGNLGSGKPMDLDLSFDVRDKADARPRRLELNSVVALNTEAQTLDVSKFTLKFMDLELKGQAQGRGLQSKPTFSGKLSVGEFVPRQLMQELGITVPATNDTTVLGKASFATAFKASTNSVQLSSLSARVDDTTLSGDIGVRDFAKPAITYQLNIDNLDLDRYLPPPSPQSKQAAAKRGAAPPAAAAVGIPVDTLRKLDVDGSIAIGKLKAYNIRSQDIKITTVAKHGNLRVHPATAKLYGGNYSGDVKIDARGREPLLSMNEKLSGVQAEPLFKDVAGKDILSGVANLTAQLTAKGAQPDAIKRTLNGLVTFSFANGAIKGVNIPLMIRRAVALINRQPTPPDEPAKTDFAELKGTATARNGLIENRDLVLQSPLLRVDGAGNANLVNEQVDYLIKAKLVASLKGEGGSSMGKLAGVPIPIRVTGNFSQPKYSVDLQQILTETQKAKIDEKKKQLEDKYRNKLQDKFKGIFGQ